MGFEGALLMLKEGFKVSREGWNGKGMWLILVDDWTLAIKYESVVAGLLPLPFIAMKTADNGFVSWLASQTDMLADDWSLVE
jgi:hypothetical protein